MLLEHMRLAQRDILEFSRNGEACFSALARRILAHLRGASDEKAWNASVAAFKRDLRETERLVADNKVDLYARLPWGDGQTVLREALLVADHNAYHLGQLVMLRKSLGQ